jgi:hypothetical protein
MYKALCATAILLVIIAVTVGRSAGIPNATLTSPLIVARGRLVNQTQPFPATTLFTPTQDGLYRLSVYATVTTADPTSNSTWSYGFSWTDDAGAESAGFVLGQNGNQLGQFYNGSYGYPGNAIPPFEAKKGIPVMHFMAHSDIPDNSAYSLYFVVERLE